MAESEELSVPRVIALLTKNSMFLYLISFFCVCVLLLLLLEKK